MLAAASVAHADAPALSVAAEARTHVAVIYDGSYQRLDYPLGDVAPDRGVCTDLVIRAYRVLGIDLQQRVHEDMRANFDAYPSRTIWGLSGPDRNIDHRRVPNLAAYFRRHGIALVPSSDAADYAAGDIVTWRLPGNLPHIGVVTHVRDTASGAPLVAHNIGAGPALENMLFDFPITGHYRYRPNGD